MTDGRKEHLPHYYFKRLWESWCQNTGSSYSQCPGGVLVNCVIWICQAAPSTSQGLLMMFPYIQYSLHLYRETALSTQCLDSLLVGSMWFSGRLFSSSHCLMMYGLLFGLSPPFTLCFIRLWCGSVNLARYAPWMSDVTMAVSKTSVHMKPFWGPGAG